MHVLKTVLSCLLGAWFCAGPVSSFAQMSLLPPTCAALNGEALDKCVRDITATQIIPKPEAVEPPPPDPSLPANCTQVLAADLEFCIGRNEIILACRNKAKYPDFAACFAGFIPNVKPPASANCAREKAELRASCAARNPVFAKCLEYPLGYFLCLANKGTLPERTLKP